MRLMCKIFGHKMIFHEITDIRPYCVRCGYQDYAMDEIVKKIVQKIEDDEFAISMKDEAEILLDLRDAYENGSLG